MRTRDHLTRLPLLVLVYAVARTAVVWGLTPQRFPDTEGYLHLDFLTPSFRLWPVPLVYALVHSDVLRVAVHVGAGVAAWGLLASVLSSGSRFPGTVRVLVLLVGLAPQVVRYDLTILSESLAISLGVATVALLVRSAERGGPDLLTAVVFVVFAMTRPQHLLLLFMVGAVVLVRAVVRRAVPGVVGIIVLCASVAGGLMLKSNSPMSDLNMYTVLTERVLNDDARFAWFTAHGMPDVPGMREAQAYDYIEQLPADVRGYLAVPAGQAPPSLMRVGGMDLARWVHNHGWSTYARYVISHPADTRARLTALAGPTMDPANDDFLPLASRAVVPRWLFPPWELCAVVTAAGAVFLLGARNRRRVGALLVCAAGTFFLYAVNVMSSGIEHPRHVTLAAVLARVCVLVAVAGVLRRGTDPAPEPTATV